MSLSKETAARVAHYMRLASELREKAEKPEYMRMRRELLDVATEWAQLADVTAKEAAANGMPATPRGAAFASNLSTDATQDSEPQP